MKRQRSSLRAAASATLLPLLIAAGTACSSGAAPSRTPASTVSATALDTATPSVEGTGPESPQPRGDSGPSLSLPSLPIGGVPEPERGAQQCVAINWVGGQFQHDISVTVNSVRLDQQSEIFALGGSCSLAGQACRSGFVLAEGTGCVVAVTRNPGVDANGVDAVGLQMSGTVHCASEATCREFAAQSQAGSSIVFLVPAGGAGSTPPSVSASVSASAS